MVALVDDEDYERVMAAGPWQASPGRHTWYAIHHGPRPKQKIVYMHRLILSAPAGREGIVDHINGDGLDNQRSNLRLSTTSQNVHNQPKRLGTSSRYKGVTRVLTCARWQADIKTGGTQRYLGLFSDEQEAAKAYDQAARVAFGEYAALNFPEEAPE
jgi:hypothetical protein